MALFTDTDIIGLTDLEQFEAGLVQIASTHDINVETKIRLSANAIADKLMLWLWQAGASDPQWTARRQVGLSTVVVTPAVYRWMCFDALARFFSEAYNVQLNTRFQGKLTEYQKEATAASEIAYTSGIGIVYQALPKPQTPRVSILAGTAPTQSYLLQTAWTDAYGNESALSPVNGLGSSSNSTISVSMAEGVSQIPAAAVGWNIYIATDTLPPSRQNSLPIFTGSTWFLPATGIVGGADPSGGQKPDYYVLDPQRILRG